MSSSLCSKLLFVASNYIVVRIYGNLYNYKTEIEIINTSPYGDNFDRVISREKLK